MATVYNKGLIKIMIAEPPLNMASGLSRKNVITLRPSSSTTKWPIRVNYATENSLLRYAKHAVGYKGENHGAGQNRLQNTH